MSDSTQPDDAVRAGATHSQAGHVTLRCRLDGPLVVELPPEGGVALRVTDHAGGEFPLPTTKRAVALCRCGHSAAKPFCDGSHKARGFAAAETAPPAS